MSHFKSRTNKVPDLLLDRLGVGESSIHLAVPYDDPIVVTRYFHCNGEGTSNKGRFQKNRIDGKLGNSTILCCYSLIRLTSKSLKDFLLIPGSTEHPLTTHTVCDGHKWIIHHDIIGLRGLILRGWLRNWFSHGEKEVLTDR